MQFSARCKVVPPRLFRLKFCAVPFGVLMVMESSESEYPGLG